MKRAPQDLIQNKTAVFWLQYPFCSTSACQLAPLGEGEGIKGFLWGMEGENNTGYHQAQIIIKGHPLKHQTPILITGTVSVNQNI